MKTLLHEIRNHVTRLHLDVYPTGYFTWEYHEYPMDLGIKELAPTTLSHGFSRHG